MTSYDLIWHLIELLLKEKETKLNDKSAKRRLEIIFAGMYRNYIFVFL